MPTAGGDAAARRYDTMTPRSGAVASQRDYILQMEEMMLTPREETPRDAPRVSSLPPLLTPRDAPQDGEPGTSSVPRALPVTQDLDTTTAAPAILLSKAAAAAAAAGAPSLPPSKGTSLVPKLEIPVVAGGADAGSRAPDTSDDAQPSGRGGGAAALAMASARRGGGGGSLTARSEVKAEAAAVAMLTPRTGKDHDERIERQSSARTKEAPPTARRRVSAALLAKFEPHEAPQDDEPETFRL